ncbi:secretin N-terminal domain-containing protein [Burkholderia sp. Bp9140]|uniref:secretin N-terminal domain-containing protein n=1 Tax=Burkholderia sp. Bp9140 TaxID=2184572 RepID=UPI00162AE34A|nr:secretin N-terminal domain-containing protein [Burkholderia sp. Bp9140]
MLTDMVRLRECVRRWRGEFRPSWTAFLLRVARAGAVAATGALLCVSLPGTPAYAGSGAAGPSRSGCARQPRPAWHLARFHYETPGASVADALSALSDATGVPIVVDGGVSGRLDGRFDASPQDFVERLARNHELDTYFDGTVLYVSPLGARRTLTLRLNFARPAVLRALLAKSGAASPCFPLVNGASGTILTVTGPPPYLERVERAARQVDGSARRRVTTAVRAVALRVGTAADRVTVVDGRQITVEGVAARARSQLAPADAAALGAVEYEAPLPVVSADARTNTVLVRDRPERLARDLRVLARLDVRPKPIVVDTLMADVAALDLARLPLGKSLSAIGIASNSTAMLVADGDALRRGIGQLSAGQRARIELDQALATYDGAAVAFRERAGTPFVAANAAPTHDDSLRAARAAADLLLVVVPSSGVNAARRETTLAVEWRVRDDVQAARVTLAPTQGIVMLEPTDAQRTRIVLLVPRQVDPH